MKEIDYKKIVDNAMRAVVRRILQEVKENGLGEGQHCYITFQTHFPGVILSDDMKEKYPDEMTVVLQHQFWNLKPESKGFSVDLSFGNQVQTIFIPFKALTYFLDPSENFVIPLEKLALEEASTEEASEEAKENNVITLDSFRKKS